MIPDGSEASLPSTDEMVRWEQVLFLPVELDDDNDVAMGSFATIKSEVRAARTGRNPSTGAALQIPEKRVASFKASTALKNALAGA